METRAFEIYSAELFDDPAHAAIRRELQQLIHARPGPVRDELSKPIGMA